MQDAYLHALLLRPPSILGRPLRPFSAAHLLALEAAGSPLLARPEETTPADLLLALYICSLSWPFELPEASGLESEARRWAGSVGAWDYAETLAAWLAYSRAYLAVPERTHKPGEGESQRAPVPFKLAVWLMRTLGASEERAWNMPLCLALAYKAGSDALDGDDSLLDDDAIAVLDKP